MTILSFSDPHNLSRMLNRRSVLAVKDIGGGRAGLKALLLVIGVAIEPGARQDYMHISPSHTYTHTLIHGITNTHTSKCKLKHIHICTHKNAVWSKSRSGTGRKVSDVGLNNEIGACIEVSFIFCCFYIARIFGGLN